MTLNDTWQKALLYIRDNIDEHLYVNWLSKTEAVHIENNLLSVKVPSAFFADFIQGKYMPAIRDALQNVFGTDLKVKFIPKEDKEKVSERDEEFYENECNLHKRYTFETFVIGESNKFAHAAAKAVSDAPSKVYNPLFIYGGVGLGKTHLMQAIGNYVKKRRPSYKVYYVPTENFMNEMISAIKNRTTIEFKDKYRKRDVLLIDDIHFLTNKEGLQEEIFHTFNSLHNGGKQIVVTSDRAPKEIPDLEDRLISRFQWGLVVDLQPPNLETRIAILRKKAELDDILIPDDVIFYIASNVKSNVRELEGCLIRLLACASCDNVDVDLELSKNVLKDIIGTQKRVTIDDIVKSVSLYYNLSEDAIRGKRRSASVVLPRQLAMYLARELTNQSLKEIGAKFGGKDHTTIIHAYEKIERLTRKDGNLNEIIERITNSLCG